jgi:hypothetical protein
VRLPGANIIYIFGNTTQTTRGRQERIFGKCRWNRERAPCVMVLKALNRKLSLPGSVPVTFANIRSRRATTSSCWNSSQAAVFVRVCQTRQGGRSHTHAHTFEFAQRIRTPLSAC